MKKIKQLVADVGGTSSNWMWKDTTGKKHHVQTDGYHPLIQPIDDLDRIFRQPVIVNVCKQAEHIYFYGTACNTTTIIKKIGDRIKDLCPDAFTEVSSDVLAAARSSCGRQPGISCILGTGSSSCVYDGKQIIDQVPSLGYILADDGSGADLGKRLLRAYYQNQLTPHVKQTLSTQYDMAKNHVLGQVYNGLAPNAFLASFAPFIKEHITEDTIYALCQDAMDDFIHHYILAYKDAAKKMIYLTGSIAWYFKDIIATRLRQHALPIGGFQKAPIEQLFDYHEQH